MPTKLKPIKKTKYHPSQKVLLEKGICPECGRKLPSRKTEIRQGGYSEFVTECGCGATYTD